ncbi:TcC31.12 [Trypanosoma grayi]|uniref:TcC31.12 n=1 Tax=Trypanosoma grayi TaxID=71804 RepID=UPI0004F45933|nr:TcC31.12 [Trypanosoma grayi]KEG08093.1 TcC31.12 [Trypanosoma grayi]
MGAVYDDAAAIFDLKASFFQVGLPEKTRRNFRCRTEREGGGAGRGHAAPHGVQTQPANHAYHHKGLAGDPESVKLRNAAPQELALHAWLDDIRIAGPRKSVDFWAERHCGKRARMQCHAWGARAPAARYEFTWVCFGHTAKTVPFRGKTLRKLRGVTSPHKTSVGGIGGLASSLVCAAGVRFFGIISF